MKLQCQIEVVNRLHSSLNIRSSGKYLKSTLAIGREPKKENGYFIIHFSSVNKTGTKYRLKSVKQVFVKCLNEGKSTIRFNEPPHDLCIKCEAVQLKCFMRLLKQCLTGDTKDVRLSTLANISVTATDKALTNLVIRDRNLLDGFLPRTLESLSLAGLNLSNFRRDILLLKHLISLILNNNEIKKLPPEFGQVLNLSELHLANNQLGVTGEVDWRWMLGPQLTKSLKLLDMSGNKLGNLPKAIWKLQSLITLKLDNNMLRELPATLGRISSLRYLTISKNYLRNLPCSLMQCQLEHLDISANQCQKTQPINGSFPLNHTLWDFYAGSLVHLSSKVVLKHKLYYASNIIPWNLVSFLDDAVMCVCGSPMVNDTVYIIKEYELKEYARIAVFDNNGTNTVGFLCYFCSPRCFNKARFKREYQVI